MPTYLYDCEACGHVLETFQSIKEDPLRRCPECKKLKLARRIGSGSGILFKGSGFYETDYRSSSYEKGQKAEKPQNNDKGKSSDQPTSSGAERPGGSDRKKGGSDPSTKSGSSD